ncbi:Hydroxylamine oxidoreductase precursor [Anaerohalosphaera lusitana]|uniref:Hydroxylamine oxidoreductase n=1 Tax=Anaerohalosphaera lusitana TaxID=1936003 RepID=A0A1U9NI87_9BACT|nr:multiheme c-type cytochrome [Anaerohalosphaera lusitana]AQT67535.1 Hydroxylamine oxidoreductase precursor [Anaerohalosphaera lusitana]
MLSTKYIAIACCSIVAVAAVVGFAADDEEEKTYAPPDPKLKSFRIERDVSEDARECITCHADESRGIVADWAESRHAHANITCLDCHQAGAADEDISQSHFEHDKTAISPIVSPKDCSRCHPAEAAEYSKSKHANTLEIIWKFDPWLNAGMNNSIERSTGCEHCHGSVVKMQKDGTFDPETWPNVGVGRVNPDGSKGSCSSCHTRHLFSVSESRKPEACGQCHLGPDHPQIEIYEESKHGAIYHAQGDEWNWDSAPGTWTPGVDYRAPTCSTCHMSGVNGVATTHDVTERLAWESQAPLTIRPSEFKPFPSKTNWKTEREKMKNVCLACHSQTWTDGHFDRYDKAIENYNEVYYKPAKKMIDQLYAKKLLDDEKPLDQELEFDMYEFWHHEGRRARFGAAMMAPDYAWWHGFYELKQRYMEIERQYDHLMKTGEPAKVHEVPGATGSTEKPAFMRED